LLPIVQKAKQVNLFGCDLDQGIRTNIKKTQTHKPKTSE